MVHVLSAAGQHNLGGAFEEHNVLLGVPWVHCDGHCELADRVEGHFVHGLESGASDSHWEDAVTIGEEGAVACVAQDLALRRELGALKRAAGRSGGGEVGEGLKCGGGRSR